MTQESKIPRLDFERMKTVCLASEEWFAQFGDITETKDGPYIYKDNGSDILFVAHLDTVCHYDHFYANKIDDDYLVLNAQLDDRLGAWIGLDYLPLLGLTYDILLTTGEETGRSTGQHFQPTKKYKWMFQFDRSGTDAVHYNYEGKDWKDALKAVGFTLSYGMFSDIKSMEHLGCMGINVGCAYYDNHGPRALASMREMLTNIIRFKNFYWANKEVAYPFTPEPSTRRFWQSKYGNYAETGEMWDRWDDWKRENEGEETEGTTATKTRIYLPASSRTSATTSGAIDRCPECGEYAKTIEDEECIFEHDMCIACYHDIVGEAYVMGGTSDKLADEDDYVYGRLSGQDKSPAPDASDVNVAETYKMVHGDEVYIEVPDDGIAKWEWMHGMVGMFSANVDDYDVAVKFENIASVYAVPRDFIRRWLPIYDLDDIVIIDAPQSDEKYRKLNDLFAQFVEYKTTDIAQVRVAVPVERFVDGALVERYEYASMRIPVKYLKPAALLGK